MNALDITDIRDLLTQSRIPSKLQKRLSTSIVGTMTSADWSNYELFNLPTKDRIAGVLLAELQGELYAVAYEISTTSSKATGRSKPIICDFCKTWQPGGRAGVITFRTARRSLNSVSFLCCLDLRCSLHVRDLTESAKTSRSQLREDLSSEQRVERLEANLLTIVQRLNLAPLDVTSRH